MHDARDRNQGVWIEPGDRLYVAAYSSVASLVVQFSGYFRKMDGEIIEWAQTVSPTSDRAVTEVNVFFGAGFLLSCVARLTTGNANRGQCYVRARVQRSTGTPLLALHNILGGYVTDDFTPSFPYGKIEGPCEGVGNHRVVTSATPAAGAFIIETVPTGARWKLRSLVALLTASVTVGNRQAFIYYASGASQFAYAVGTHTWIATNTPAIGFGIGNEYAYSAENLTETIALPDMMLNAGHTFNVGFSNMAAGDQFAAALYEIEEWIEA